MTISASIAYTRGRGYPSLPGVKKGPAYMSGWAPNVSIKFLFGSFLIIIFDTGDDDCNCSQYIVVDAGKDEKKSNDFQCW